MDKRLILALSMIILALLTACSTIDGTILKTECGFKKGDKHEHQPST